MGFSPEVIARRQEQQERDERRSRWICTPGWHIVEIVGYHRSAVGRGGTAVFDLRDDQGREQTVRFSLSIPVLRGGELLRFWAAAMNRRLVELQGCELSIASARSLRALVGRRLAVFVAQNSKGLHDVIGWKAIEPPA